MSVLIFGLGEVWYVTCLGLVSPLNSGLCLTTVSVKTGLRFDLVSVLSGLCFGLVSVKPGFYLNWSQ